jgi:hypothetical protein
LTRSAESDTETKPGRQALQSPIEKAVQTTNQASYLINSSSDIPYPGKEALREDHRKKDFP